ncbi:hypothetical protein GQ53DRAFT_740239 [Thozetella sp. PMI_491]|nr:hypothetical protein GQ53DRAFT_740239 [Thozetella sp. PMI_491]
MSGTPPSLDPITLTTELKLADSSQLSLGNRASIGPTELLNCTVTTTISDVRRGFFVDGKDGRRRHEAVVVVFEFEFGSQERRSWNPLNKINTVKVGVSADEDEIVQGSGGSQQLDDESELRIVGWFPIAAKSAGSEKLVKKKFGVTLDPSALGVSGGSLSLGRESESTEIRCANLSSSRNGDMGMIWKLEEGGEERGVPGVFAGAILLQTDGLAFSLEIQYTVPFLGRLYKGKTEVSIKNHLLWERKGRESWESEWDDFDSNEFKDWVKRKTKNSWAAVADYGISDE